MTPTPGEVIDELRRTARTLTYHHPTKTLQVDGEKLPIRITVRPRPGHTRQTPHHTTTAQAQRDPERRDTRADGARRATRASRQEVELCPKTTQRLSLDPLTE
jgi:hypothetical protein